MEKQDELATSAAVPTQTEQIHAHPATDRTNRSPEDCDTLRVRHKLEAFLSHVETQQRLQDPSQRILYHALLEWRYHNSRKRQTKARSSSKRKYDAASTQDLGIGLDAATLVAPSVVRSKADFYRKEFCTEDVWRIKPAPARVDFSSPERFPLRDPVDFLHLRAMQKAEVERSKRLVWRPCRGMEEQRLADVDCKKRAVAARREQVRERRLRLRLQREARLKEVRMAVEHDYNARKVGVDVAVSCTSTLTVNANMNGTRTRRVIRQIIPVRVFTPPYLVSVVTDETERDKAAAEGTAALPRLPQSIRKSVQTVFIRLVSGSATDTGNDVPEEKIKVQQFLADIAPEMNLSYSPAGKSVVGKVEHIVVLPKAFGFGDAAPREIGFDEYSENFKFYRLDPATVLDFVKKNGINPDAEISVKKLREVLEMAALPLESEEDRTRYKDMLDKERRRKERLESSRMQSDEARKHKREQREHRNEEHLHELEQAEREGRLRLLGKEKTAAEKLHLLRSEELKRHRTERLEKGRPILRDSTEEIHRFITGVVLKRIVGNAVEISEARRPAGPEAETDTSAGIFTTKDSRPVPQRKKRSRDHRIVPTSQAEIQTSFPVRADEPMNVQVDSEAVDPPPDEAKEEGKDATDRETTTFDVTTTEKADASNTSVSGVKNSQLNRSTLEADRRKQGARKASEPAVEMAMRKTATFWQADAKDQERQPSAKQEEGEGQEINKERWRRQMVVDAENARREREGRNGQDKAKTVTRAEAKEETAPQITSRSEPDVEPVAAKIKPTPPTSIKNPQVHPREKRRAKTKPEKNAGPAEHEDSQAVQRSEPESAAAISQDEDDTEEFEEAKAEDGERAGAAGPATKKKPKDTKKQAKKKPAGAKGKKGRKSAAAVEEGAESGPVQAQVQETEDNGADMEEKGDVPVEQSEGDKEKVKKEEKKKKPGAKAKKGKKPGKKSGAATKQKPKKGGKKEAKGGESASPADPACPNEGPTPAEGENTNSAQLSPDAPHDAEDPSAPAAADSQLQRRDDAVSPESAQPADAVAAGANSSQISPEETEDGHPATLPISSEEIDSDPAPLALTTMNRSSAPSPMGSPAAAATTQHKSQMKPGPKEKRRTDQAVRQSLSPVSSPPPVSSAANKKRTRNGAESVVSIPEAEGGEEKKKDGPHVQFRVKYEDEEFPAPPPAPAGKKQESKAPGPGSQTAVAEKSPDGHPLTLAELKRNLKVLQGIIPDAKSGVAANKFAEAAAAKGPAKKEAVQGKEVEQHQVLRRPSGGVNPNSKRPTGFDEEDQLTAFYKKLLEEREKEDEEKRRISELQSQLKTEEEAVPEKKVDESVDDSDDEQYDDQIILLLSGGSTNLTAEQVKKKLASSKRLARIIARLRKDENIKNILLQRTQADIDGLMACQGVLGNFFSPERFPDFSKGNLALSRFTPAVEIDKDLFDLPAGKDDPGIAEDDKTRTGEAGKDKQGPTGAGSCGRIVPRNIEFMFASAERQLNAIFAKASANYDELVNNPAMKDMVPQEKVETLRYHLRAMEQIIASRKRELEELKRTPKHVRVLSLGATPERKEDFSLPEIKANRPSQTELGSNKKYKVNIEMISRRTKMSQLEIMERRYQLLSDRDPHKSARTYNVSPRPSQGQC